MEQKSKKTLKRAIIAISCLVLAAAVFCGGWFGGLYWGNAQFRSYRWALGLIEEHYLGDFDSSYSENSVYALAATLDAYSAYYSAEEYQALLADNSGSKSGIGVTYEYVTEEEYGDTGCLIISVVGNSPACRAGLRAGEVIASGTASGGSAGDAAGGTTTYFTQSADFSSFISSQPEGEEFTLTATDGTVYTVARGEYQASYAWMQTNDETWTFEYETEGDTVTGHLACDETQGMGFLPDGFAYIRLQQFYGTADQEMDILIGEFNESGCTSLILDLRSNGGGSVSTMQKIAGCFVPDGTETVAMTAVYKDGSSNSYPIGTSNENTINEGTDIYILANNGTASASEALMGVLLSCNLTDYSRIYLSDFGDSYLSYTSSSKNRRTYGKGIMQSTYVNALTGEALKLTVAKIYWPNGNCIHDTGITAADGCNTVSTPWVATKGDLELQDAVRMISGN